MRALSNSDLLTLWEQGFGLHPLDQGLLALSAALPQAPPQTLADWPLGRKNRALVRLHCACFNSRLQAWAACNRCGEKMEFDLDAAAFVGGEKDEDCSRGGTIRVKEQSFRLPTSRDLAEAAREQDARAAAVRVLERCRMAEGETPVWTDVELEEIEEALALADPSAETRVSLRCPGCACEWDEALDLAIFLWAEITARAKRLLWETHALASAYGWTQAEILSLSEARRGLYLEMVRG